MTMMPTTKRRFTTIAIITLVMFVAGSNALAETPAPATRPAAAANVVVREPAAGNGKAYVLHLPGIGGARGLDRMLIRGLKAGGFDISDTYDWTANDPGIGALLATERNLKQARRVAQMIAAFHRKDPEAEIHLVAHSGGTGIAVWALEALPPNVKIQTLTLLASALSPDYDLSKALRHVERQAFAFTSLRDSLVLGVGTQLFATIDGKKAEAGGMVGFVKPDGADDNQYAKLAQFPYDPIWTRFDNMGDHIGPMHDMFAANVLAPLILKGIMPPLSPTTQPATQE
jgi:pimeloyl-ACP methyl ester carboxylesterase